MRYAFLLVGIICIFFVSMILVGARFLHILPHVQVQNDIFHTNQKRQQSFQEMINPVASLSAVLTATAAAYLNVTPVVNSVPPVITGEKAYNVPILLYHYISRNENKNDTIRTGLSTPPDVFEAQLALLSQHGFTTITLDELAAAFSGAVSLPAKPVILTFDDGYEDFYANAAPLMKKYNMKGMSFIPTGLVGGGNYMTWSQIEELAHTPNVVFGAHSVHHYVLPSMNDVQLNKEVIDSKKVLENHVGYRINWFCYPYGSFDARVVGMVKNAGFVGSLTTLPGVWHYQSRFFYIPRLRAGTRTGENFLKLLQ